ncbi:unnamed protein product [Adineta steineri]|uniref:Uncharacterized protein n=1 Tax=Adineta steineri TaxID=433720 RepID=A0A819AN26_9BILA|nr:unnamed protein product [Adineta steineri]CAF1512510.1 unnamed protein product [Adineta steineri]CAF3708468.1 unnamed protein product [Adineta steineri]CAF3787425.1 unnamed protein product [Adineta steineri]
MLTRFRTITQKSTIPISLRLFNTSTLKLSDGDHTLSKAFVNASDDIKAGLAKRWLDTVATDSEAIVKGEMQFNKKYSDWRKDLTKIQLDTIEAIKDKSTQGYMHQFDIGRRDTPEERSNIDIRIETDPKEKY